MNVSNASTVIWESSGKEELSLARKTDFRLKSRAGLEKRNRIFDITPTRF